MSRIRKLVEGILAQHPMKEDWESDLDWKKFNSYGDNDEAYEEWLENQDWYTKYAVYVGDSEKYGRMYALYDQGWEQTNELDNSFDDLPHLWSTPQEAEKIVHEYKNAYPDSDPRVVEVYSDREDGIYSENKEDIYPFEKWENEVQYGYEDPDDRYER